ncbi:MAG TPA: 8-amino-7-oxononanoate synthase [Solirubrobacteraceae bacterium]|jgi:glycine C-acetyltransferase/8-amino-7-oxononanoate synthase|nr:8-amino-7-oxononanoate synthase [Solirubrobacteraceae bacterium]
MNGELGAGEIEERLAELERAGLTRRLRLVSGPQGPTVLLDGQPVLLLCSNNYLGLADHPRVCEAAAEAAMRWGVGAGASRLISGTMTVHRRLEERLAAFAGRQSCLLFGSGYLANLGVIGALAGRGDTVFSDELNHASIVDGCRLSRAEVVVYRHADVEHLLWSMRRHSGRGNSQGGRLIVTDSVFSMDGDVAPLAEIVELAHASGARVAVDEAHAIGTYGPGGRGVLAEQGLEGEVDAIVATLGKALGSYGAYVCGDEEMVRYMLNTSRSFIFSTAPPPPAMAGALAALELLQERPHRVERLNANARTLRRALASEGFGVAESDMHIVPLVVGDERDTLRLCQETIERGVFAQAIRPPTVPAGTSRLRLAAMASHTATDMRMAAEILAAAARKLGLDPAQIGTPLPESEPEPVQESEEAREREMYEATLARSTQPAPFDVEQPRPRRPPAPAHEDMGDGNAPFDGERESAVAHAA